MNELPYWIALTTVPYCGLRTILKLLKIFREPSAILSASKEALLSVGASPFLAKQISNPNWKKVDYCLAWAEKPKNQILYWGCPYYPLLLREIPTPPCILFVTGELSVLRKGQLDIIGARGPTPTGLEIAYQLAYELCKVGFGITSGLAYGIDGAAHRAAMAARSNSTIAVLGSGLNRIYPNSHYFLAQKIIEKGGVLLSEFFPETPPRPRHFPRRNRLISGLSLGVIVVEATVRSGSLITAHHALEQGREVFAVPGSIRNPLTRGCHALIKEGAVLVETSEDIIQSLNLSMLNSVSAYPTLLKSKSISNLKEKQDIFPNRYKDKERVDSANKKTWVEEASNKMGLDSRDIKLVEYLGFETTSLDTLIQRTGLSIDILLARLSLLELKGCISAVPGGYVRK